MLSPQPGKIRCKQKPGVVSWQPAGIHDYNPDNRTANVHNVELYYENIPVVTPIFLLI